MEAVAFEHIDKSFGAVAALRDVSFAVLQGESHGIVGENGAGKSTLLNILAGSVRPDRGHLTLEGAAVALASPRDALARGIGLVHQEMLAFPNLSAAENIFDDAEGRYGPALVRRRLVVGVVILGVSLTIVPVRVAARIVARTSL